MVMLEVEFIVGHVSFRSWQEFHLRWVEPLVITMPDVRRMAIDVPGRNGLLDFSDAISGLPAYKNRTLQLHFESDAKSYEEWSKISSNVANALHGKKVMVILGTDKAYYYKGIASVIAEKTGKIGGHIIVDIDAQPFKITVQPDDTYRNIAINGTCTVTVPRVDQPTVPTIVLSGADDMFVTFAGGKQLLLGRGDNKIMDIVIGPWKNEFRFVGTGTISIIYERGSL